LFLTPLDQFVDLCAGLPSINGDFINLLPALFIGIMGGSDD